MAWIYLFLGGLFEIGWPLGFKLAHGSSGKILWITFSGVVYGFERFVSFYGSENNSDRYGLCRLDRNRCCRNFIDWHILFQ